VRGRCLNTGEEAGDILERQEENSKKDENSKKKFNWAEYIKSCIAPPFMCFEITLVSAVEVILVGPMNVSVEPVSVALMTHRPQDFSGLHSSTLNPWGSLHHHHYSHYPHAPHQFTCQRQYPPIYPVNTYLHTAPTPKPPTSTSVHIFEMVTHPCGIGPLKPVIRVPT
jgi:hypothetical protein